MPQKGTHTWDLIIEYHRCPECGAILESRKDYEYRLGRYFKEIECYRCNHTFQLEKKTKPSFAPLLGDPQPIEIDWISRRKKPS